MSKWVLSKEENVGQEFIELVFVASEKCRTDFCREGNRRTGFCWKRKSSSQVLSKKEIIEMGFVTSEKCQTGFCRKGNRRTGLLSQEEIVKPDFVKKGKRQAGFVERKIVE